MKNLKSTSKELSNDIQLNNEWINKEINFVIDGSYDNYNFNQMLLDTYKKDAINRGKRGSNLIARIGIEFISKAYNCNTNQAVTVFKYLSKEEQEILNKDILDNLDAYIEMMEA